MPLDRRLHSSRDKRLLLPVLPGFRDDVYSKKQKTEIASMVTKSRRRRILQKVAVSSKLKGFRVPVEAEQQEREVIELRERVAAAVKQDSRAVVNELGAGRDIKCQYDKEVAESRRMLQEVESKILEAETKLRRPTRNEKEYTERLESIHEESWRECAELESAMQSQQVENLSLQKRKEELQLEFDQVHAERMACVTEKPRDSMDSVPKYSLRRSITDVDVVLDGINQQKSELVGTIHNQRETLLDLNRIHSYANTLFKLQKRYEYVNDIMKAQGAHQRKSARISLRNLQGSSRRGRDTRATFVERVPLNIHNVPATMLVHAAVVWSSDIHVLIRSLHELFWSVKYDGKKLRRLLKRKMSTWCYRIVGLAETAERCLRGGDESEVLFDALELLRRQLRADNRIKKKRLLSLVKYKRIWRGKILLCRKHLGQVELNTTIEINNCLQSIKKLELRLRNLKHSTEDMHSSCSRAITWRATAHRILVDQLSMHQGIIRKHDREVAALKKVEIWDRNEALISLVKQKSIETVSYLAHLKHSCLLTVEGMASLATAAIEVKRIRENIIRRNVSNSRRATALELDGVPYLRSVFECEKQDAAVDAANPEDMFLEDIYKSSKNGKEVSVTLFNEDEVVVRMLHDDAILYYYTRVDHIGVLFEDYVESTWWRIGEKLVEALEIVPDAAGPTLVLTEPPPVEEVWAFSPLPPFDIEDASCVVSTACRLNDVIFEVTMFELPDEYMFRIYSTALASISWTHASTLCVLRFMGIFSREKFRRCLDAQRRLSQFARAKFEALFAKGVTEEKVPLQLQEESSKIGLELSLCSGDPIQCTFFRAEKASGSLTRMRSSQILPETLTEVDNKDIKSRASDALLRAARRSYALLAMRRRYFADDEDEWSDDYDDDDDDSR